MKLEKIKNKKKSTIMVIVALVIGLTIVLATSLAAYKKTTSIPLASGEVNYIIPDMKIVAIYQENGVDEDGNKTYEIFDNVPTNDYVLNSDNSYCEANGSKIEATINYNATIRKLSIMPITAKGTKCYLYFDIAPKNYILANSVLGNGTPVFANTSCSTQTDGVYDCGEQTVGLYEAEDDDGTSYYYRGDVEDNYVKFAGFYWRIIRINGNGSIRMIYAGEIDKINNKEEVLANGYDDSITLHTKIERTTFSGPTSSSEYVGFKYALNEEHGTSSKSTILSDVLEPWYENNIFGTNFEKYIDTESGFCGDRSLSTYYGAYERLSSNKTPSLKCNNSLDLYTVKNEANIGNEDLTYPIGLISADEVAYAGGVVGSENVNYYLYTGYYYWTLSPYEYTSNSPDVFAVKKGDFGTLLVSYWYYGTDTSFHAFARPVINLRANVSLTGSGTISEPYEILTS